MVKAIEKSMKSTLIYYLSNALKHKKSLNKCLKNKGSILFR